jgi:membrane protease YdiL (CAAX protease family)
MKTLKISSFLVKRVDISDRTGFHVFLLVVIPDNRGDMPCRKRQLLTVIPRFMNSVDEKRNTGQPRLFSIILVLLIILVAYPLAGTLLTMLVTGGRPLDDGFRWVTDAVLPRLLAVQAVGQIVLLALPAFLLVSRFNDGGVFGRAGLDWLGIGRRGGLLSAMAAGAGMLLLQPLLYSIVELQTLLLPLLGEVGRSIIQEQARLDLLIAKLAGGSSPAAFLWSVLVLVLTPAFCEELFFRGYVQKSIELNLSPQKAVLFTGLVFALFHMEWFNIVPLTLLGWYIGYIYVKSDNLLVPVAAHGVNNLAALVFLKVGSSSGGSVAASSGILVLWQWWLLVLVSLVVFFLLIRYFPVKPVLQHTDNPMPGGHR